MDINTVKLIIEGLVALMGAGGGLWGAISAVQLKRLKTQMEGRQEQRTDEMKFSINERQALFTQWKGMTKDLQNQVHHTLTQVAALQQTYLEAQETYRESQAKNRELERENQDLRQQIVELRERIVELERKVEVGTP